MSERADKFRADLTELVNEGASELDMIIVSDALIGVFSQVMLTLCGEEDSAENQERWVAACVEGIEPLITQARLRGTQ